MIGNRKFILTFEWHSLLKDLRQQFPLIILAGLVAVAAVLFFYSPSYTSTATLALQPENGAAFEYLSDSADMAEVLAAVFEEPALAELAAENLGRNTFDGTITAAAADGLNIMTIGVTASEPELAYRLLNSVLEVMPGLAGAVFPNTALSILESPQIPLSPSNEITTAQYVLLFLLAAALQAMVVAFFSLSRDTIKHESAFAQRIDAPLLGTVSHEKINTTQPLMPGSGSVQFAEDFRKLAARLEHLQNRQGYRTFLLTSVLGGEGRSTVAANIAQTLIDRGYRVLLVGQESGGIKHRISEADNHMDFVIIDAPAMSVSADAAELSALCDAVLLVIRTDFARSSKIDSALETVRRAGGNLAGCILNDAYPPLTLFGLMGAAKDSGIKKQNRRG